MFAGITRTGADRQYQHHPFISRSGVCMRRSPMYHRHIKQECITSLPIFRIAGRIIGIFGIIPPTSENTNVVFVTIAHVRVIGRTVMRPSADISGSHLLGGVLQRYKYGVHTHKAPCIAHLAAVVAIVLMKVLVSGPERRGNRGQFHKCWFVAHELLQCRSELGMGGNVSQNIGRAWRIGAQFERPAIVTADQPDVVHVCFLQGSIAMQYVITERCGMVTRYHLGKDRYAMLLCSERCIAG